MNILGSHRVNQITWIQSSAEWSSFDWTSTKIQGWYLCTDQSYLRNTHLRFCHQTDSLLKSLNIAVDMPRIYLPCSCSASLTLNSPYVNKFICATLFYSMLKQIVAFQLCACVVGVHKKIVWEVTSGSFKVGRFVSNGLHSGKDNGLF